MRLLRFLFCYLLLSVACVILALFLAQNWGATHISFFGLDYSVHLAWVLAGSAAFGALATFVLLLPGRLAAMVHRWDLERELQQWEQDLWKLQQQQGRLVSRHERLLEAHERVLQAYHRLVGEHSQIALERDEIRAQMAQMAQIAQMTQMTQVAATRTSAAHQPARVASMPHVAVVSSGSPGSPVSAGGRSAIPAAGTSRPHVHEVSGGRRSMSAPRWAVPCPPGRTAPAPVARVSGAPLQRAVADHVAGDASEILPGAPAASAAPEPVAMQQPVEQPLEPGPVVVPLSAAGDPTPLRAAPRTVPVLSREPVASEPSAAPAGLATSPVIPLPSLRWAADRTIALVTPRLEKVRTWLRATFAAMVTALAAQRVLLEARLAQLKRSILQGELPLESDASRTSSASVELPSDDRRR